MLPDGGRDSSSKPPPKKNIPLLSEKFTFYPPVLFGGVLIIEMLNYHIISNRKTMSFP